MRKRHEALRRGLRSLIQDTSRELAHLEGREALVSPVPEVDDRRIPPASPRPGDAGPDGTAAATPAPVEVDGAAPVRPAPREVDGAAPIRPALPAANGAAPSAPATRPNHAPAKAAPRTRSGGTRRRARHRVVPLPKDDGVSPQQAQSRKGVCFAYFINAECWRVPEAYCNTALEVCITRECPVFRLHKDALERRFAGKYKHFW